MQNQIQEMRLFSKGGHRLYLSAAERRLFLDAATDEKREDRIYCHVLHYTGCRPSEALELTPRRILLDSHEIVLRSLKKRRYDTQGRQKQPQYRCVPIIGSLTDQMDLVFELRRGSRRDERLWSMSRSTAWRVVKRVMNRAGIEGPQATAKGLRHGFGIAMLSGQKPLPLNVLRDLMGHTDTKTTEIYLQAIGYEKRNLVMQAWNDQ
ncbi:MAG: site-specific integrase [Sedimenticola sp.]